MKISVESGFISNKNLTIDNKFIYIKNSNGCFEASGDYHVSLGHKINLDAKGISDGIFVEWDWDGQSLTLKNCQYGLYPVYYFVNNHEICISTSLVVVLEKTRSIEIDDIAIAVFLRLGFFLENDTPFKNIRALPAGAKLCWSPGSFKMEEAKILAKPSNISRDEAVDRYITLFRASIEKRLSKTEFALPLSGGRDSRHIFLELCRIDRKPKFCLTAELFPPRSNEDMKVARQLCEIYGVKHIPIYQESFYLEAVLRKNLITDFCSDEHTWALTSVSFLNNSDIETIYDGIGGDVLSAGLFLSAKRLQNFRTGNLNELSKDLLGDIETSIKSILTSQTYQIFSYEKASTRLLSVLEKHIDQPNPVSSFMFWNRTRREISLYTLGMFSQKMNIFCPYLDNQLFDHLISLPGEMFLDKQFHTETIARAFPDNTVSYGLPDSDKNSDMGWHGLKKRNFYTRIAADLFRYLIRRRNEKYVNKNFIIPRLAYYFIDGDDRHIWFEPEKVIYLVQLERIIQKLS